MSEIVNQLKTLTEAWPAKIAATFIGFIVSELFQLHLHLFLLFALLEFIDCGTKWLALAYLYIKDQDASSKPTLWDCIKGIPAAHRANYIKSETMRKQFGNKMLTYLILIVSAGTGDYVIRLIGKTDILLSLVVTYISATEFLSVLENLNDAGVSMAASILAMVKQKTGIGGGPNDSK